MPVVDRYERKKPYLPASGNHGEAREKIASDGIVPVTIAVRPCREHSALQGGPQRLGSYGKRTVHTQETALDTCRQDLS
jgi:hypothetical protein